MITPLALLLVDDNPLSLPVYEKYLSNILGHDIDCASTAAEAWHLARRRLYDLVICDAKLPYRNSALGGLILAEELARRFGKDSVLVISQYIEENDLITQSIGLPFLKKPDSMSQADWFTSALGEKIRRMKKRQFGFAAMPFGNSDLDKLFTERIKKACRDAGYKVIRVDEDPSSENIINKIFSLIDDAHFLIFITTEKNPNVFYEAGYAFARKKEIIMCAPSLNDLPFDVRSNVCMSYLDREDSFEEELKITLKRLNQPARVRKKS